MEPIKPSKITINLSDVEFTCFKGRKSIFGSSPKYFYPLFTIAPYFYLLQKAYPQKTKNILYDVGKQFGYFIMQSYISQVKRKSVVLFKKCFDELESMGFGKTSFKQSTKIIFSLRSNPMSYLKKAKGLQKIPFDSLYAGIYSGFLAAYYTKNYVVKETSCILQGSSSCIFETSLLPNKNIAFKPFLTLDNIFHSLVNIENNTNSMAERMSKSNILTLQNGFLKMSTIEASYVPVQLFHLLQYQFTEEGLPAFKYHFNMTIMQSFRACEYQRFKFGVKKDIDVIQKVLDQWELIGIGHMKLNTYLPKKNKLIVNLTESNWLENYKYTFIDEPELPYAFLLGAIYGIAYFLFPKKEFSITYETKNGATILIIEPSKKGFVHEKNLLNKYFKLTEPKFFNV